MSLIEQLEKISAKIFQESIKIYKLKDVTVHKRAKPNSLIECLSMYPNKGVGFYLKKKSWTSDLHVRVTEAHYKSNRFGALRGLSYKDGQQEWKMPKKLSGTSKRGIWTFTVGEARDVELDNGMIYTTKDYQALMDFRKRLEPKPSQASTQEPTETPGEETESQEQAPEQQQK